MAVGGSLAAALGGYLKGEEKSGEQTYTVVV